MVVENFNDYSVNLRVVVNDKVDKLRNLLNNEQLKPAEVTYGNHRFYGYNNTQTVFDIMIPAHSYMGLGY